MPGRHRAPSTSGHTAARVATGAALITTGALAIPATASAASQADWEAVAECESGGNWSIDTGNGYYGGLQFLDTTWHAYGGTTTHASGASEATQIAVAERVLASQGPGAWPVCGRGHLTGGSSTATRPSTSASAVYYARCADAPGPIRRGQPGYRAALDRDNDGTACDDGASGATTAPRTTTPRPSSPATSVAQPTTTSSSPRTTGTRTPVPASGGVTATEQVEGGGTTVTDLPGQQRREAVSTVRVMPGDTLSGIAVRFHVPGGWPTLARLNASVVPNPDLIFPGQTLRLR